MLGDTDASFLVRLTSQEDSLNQHLRECAEWNKQTGVALKALADGHEKIITKIDSFEKLPGRVVKGVLGMVAAAMVTLLIQTYIVNAHSAPAPTPERDQAIIELIHQNQQVISRLEKLAP